MSGENSHPSRHQAPARQGFGNGVVLRLENVVKTLKTDPCHIQFRLEIEAGIMEGPEPGNDHKSDKTPEGRKKKHYTGWL